MKILITGVAGLLGSRLAEHIVNNVPNVNSFMMPNTKIIQYIFNKYSDYLDRKHYMSSLNDDYVVKMKDLFLIDINIANKNKINIVTTPLNKYT